MKYEALFKGRKPLIGMIHTGCMQGEDMLETAKREIEIYLKNGMYPLIENYFGTSADCEKVLAWLQEYHPKAVYGVNILGDAEEAFLLARTYGARFIQIDSVCGHLEPDRDEEYAEELKILRKKCDVVLLGGVRFKYQPIRSGRSLKEELLLGMERCDAIVCTGEGTGIPTPIGKVQEFKSVLNEFPVIVGAGVTIDTVEETFRLADGAIVGSWVKDNHDAYNPVNEQYVELMSRKIDYDNSLKNLTHVVFSHGKESGPFGSKIQCLMAVAEEMGLRTTSIDYRDCVTADERVAMLKEHLNQLDVPLRQVVLVGSSMGGYVSMVAANERPVAGLFLMAPALWMKSEDYTIQTYIPKAAHIEIVHGMLDDTVPYENSIRFAREHDGTILHLVPDDHRLKASHEFLACQFRRFLDDISK